MKRRNFVLCPQFTEHIKQLKKNYNNIEVVLLCLWIIAMIQLGRVVQKCLDLLTGLLDGIRKDLQALDGLMLGEVALMIMRVFMLRVTEA